MSAIVLTGIQILRKIQGDTALMTKVFGKENMAAAIALINTADVNKSNCSGFNQTMN